MSGFSYSESAIREQIGADGTFKSGLLTANSKANVSFRLHAVLDGDRSAERGYPAYRETVYFSRRDVDRGREDGVDRQATDADFEAYPEAFERFRQWIAAPQISVRVLPYLSPAVLRLLEDGEIGTVQELAGAPNLSFRDLEGKIVQRVAIDSVPELKEPREIARHWLSMRPTTVSAAIPETENERLRRELAAAQAALAAPKNKGGRPKGSKNQKGAPHVEDAQADS